jgi:hypothetical protein
MRLSNAVFFILILGGLCMTAAAQLPENIKANSSCGVIKSAEITSNSSNLDPGNSQVTFILSWQNVTSNLDMVIGEPDGQEIDSNAKPPILYQKTDNTVQYIIPDPQAGNWTAQISASMTPKSGETYCLLTLLTLAEVGATNNESENITQGCPTCNQSG